MPDVRILLNDDVVDLATPDEYIEVVRDAYRQHGEGAPTEPRTKLTMDEFPEAKLTGYMAILPDSGVMGGDMYTARFSDQPSNHISLLYDYPSGELMSILDSTYSNPFKTGAVGALGVDVLARRDATTVGVIGSGRQALAQLVVTAEVRDIDGVSVFSPTPAHRETFAERASELLDADVAAVDDSEGAVSGSDIVITATKSSEPVFDGEHLESGAHVTAVGQYWADKRELDSTTLRRSKYVIDLRSRAFQDAGSFLLALEDGAISEDHIYAELGEIVTGELPGREHDDEITVFDSGGTALETVAAGNLLFEKARADDRGQLVDFSFQKAFDDMVDTFQ